MSALTSFKEFGLEEVIRLFSNGKKAVVMLVFVDPVDGLNVEYEVSHYNTVAVRTKHVELALETYDKL